MSPHIEDVLLTALGQAGDPYIFGAKGHPLDPDPDAFDCSGLVKWACDRAGVDGVPHGAYGQWLHCRTRGTTLSTRRALTVRGSLLFVGSGVGVGRDAITHVAWSLGDGTTIEARGAMWGVGTWAAAGRFQFAGELPGIDYRPRVPVWPHEEEPMQTFDITIREAGMLQARPLDVFSGQQGEPIKAAQVVSVEALDDTSKRVAVLDTTGDLLLKGPGRYLVVTHV